MMESCNFTMLSQKMCTLFIHYILGGRIRAPPEADLTFLISTFQYGAKTDRRALQSKFKSWSKRMIVENHKLKLIYTGKEIIPLEESCKVVMHIHFQGHLSVDEVIKQVQRQYTWTKKNFGLDREMIVGFILKNCKNVDCIRTVKSIELVRNYRCNDFIKDVILSSESGFLNQQNQVHQKSLSITNIPAVSSLSTGDYSSTSSCAIRNSFPPDFKTTCVNRMNPISEHSTQFIYFKESQKNILNNMQETACDSNAEYSDKNNISLKAKTPLRIAPRSFRKPKNVIDFQALLSAAEQYSDYPAVLYSPKTKFLANFGLAPKRICSKRTLAKVENEKKRRKARYIQAMMCRNQNRKNLRDRNKLYKIKLKEQLKKHSYLDKFKRNPVGGVRNLSSKNALGSTKDESYNFNSNASNKMIGSVDNDEIDIREVVSKNEEPEVIDIASSDDESNLKSLKASVDNKKLTSLKSNVQETKTLSSQHLSTFSQKDKETSDCIDSTCNYNSPETPKGCYPILKQSFVMPSNFKGEAVVLPTSQCNPKVLSNQNKPVKFSKDVMLGKKAVLQPLTSVMKTKSLNMQNLPISGVTSKIPHGTNIYLMQKQSNGIIKMVPCSKIVRTKSTSASCSQEVPKGDRTTTVGNPTEHVSVPIKTKYRSIRPATDSVVDTSRRKALEENKLFIDEEMAKLSKWIGGMRGTMARALFQLNFQRSRQRLESQLNAAIALVKNIRRKLWEVEKLEEKLNNNITPTVTKNVV